MIKISGLVASLVLLVNISYVWSDCDITKEAADKCGMKMGIFGNREQSMPSNDAELDAVCAQMRTNGKCIRDFNARCLTGRVQMAIEIALNNGKAFIDRRCDVPKDRAEFLKHVKCIIPKDKMEHFHICADKHVVMLSKLKEVPKADRVATLCCTAHIGQQCMRDAFKTHCNEDTQGYWDDAWDELTNANMEFACQNFDTLAKCESGLNPTALKAIKDVAALDEATAFKLRQNFKSEITTAVELMEFFD